MAKTYLYMYEIGPKSGYVVSDKPELTSQEFQDIVMPRVLTDEDFDIEIKSLSGAVSDNPLDWSEEDIPYDVQDAHTVRPLMDIFRESLDIKFKPDGVVVINGERYQKLPAKASKKFPSKPKKK